ncbi:MAG: nucleotidyltransferase domain-containing protein [Candidatus Pacearchaeota archaeon]
MVETKNETIKNQLKDFLKKVNNKFGVEKALLFGSRARDDFFSDSDVDLIVVSEDFSGLSFRERIIEVQRLWNGDVELEVLCYTPGEFEKKKQQQGLVREASKEGAVLS